MVIHGSFNNRIAAAFSGMMTDRYAAKLKRLESVLPLQLSAPSFSRQLTDLNLDLDKDTVRWLPSIYIESLQNLTLYNMRSDSMQNLLGNATTTKEMEAPLVFSRLISLYAFFSSNEREEAHPCRNSRKLGFPKLERLFYNSPCAGMTMLESANLPTKMHSLIIRSSHNGFERIENLSLPEMDQLSLSLDDMNEGAGPRTLPLINRILVKAQATYASEIWLDDRHISFDPQAIDYEGLTRLRVAAPTNIETVITTINKFPRLTALTFRHLTADTTVPAEIPVKDLADNTPLVLEPFATSVERLYIEYRANQYPQQTLLAVAKYLLLRMPSLTDVLLRNLPESLFQPFIAAYKGAYPHLKHITMH
ncbi:hypothetical protein GGF46_003206 [Coemansia sp. RSA 552]|nr:hypothetical protein GGF46_003206 [Coemansia sp. RSA 552]